MSRSVRTLLIHVVTLVQIASAASAEEQVTLCDSLLQHSTKILKNQHEEDMAKASPSFFVAVLSRADAEAQRRLLRESRSGLKRSQLNVTMKFVICREEVSPGKDGQLQQEVDQFDDVIVLPCREAGSPSKPFQYRELKLKVKAAMKAYMGSYGDRDLFMKMDDDTFLSWTRLKRHLMGLNSLINLYMGYEPANDLVPRRPGYPWYTPRESWPFDKYPKTMQGGAYILSRGLLKKAFAAGLHANYKLPSEDRAVAYWVDLVKSAGTAVNFVRIPGTSGYSEADIERDRGPSPDNKPYITEAVVKKGKWSEYPYVAHHHLSTEQIHCLDSLESSADGDAMIDHCFQEL